MIETTSPPAALFEAGVPTPDAPAAPAPRNAALAAPAVLSAPPGTRAIFILKSFVPRIFEGKDTFEKSNFLEANRLRLTTKPQEADIFLGRRPLDFKRLHLGWRRLNIVWTHEPFFSTDSVPMVLARNKHRIHIFNVYNGNVYTDNYFDLTTDRKVPKVSAADLNTAIGDKKIVAVMTNKAMSAKIDGVERSLTGPRSRLALEGDAAGGMDIYGGGWDEGVALSDTRYAGDRRAVKRQILSGYNFNFCAENCSWDYYVTEKLWEAIVGRCIPIYYRGSTFEHLSFSDAAILVDRDAGFPAVRDRIENIGEAEFVERLNTLIAGYNHAAAIQARLRSRQRSKDRFVAFLRAHT